jgi:hypothetical protein
MKVDAYLEILLVFRAKNKDMCMGCYYPEDDWEIVVTAKNIPELETNVAERIIESGIIIKGVKCCSAEYLIYDNNKFFLQKVSDLDANSILSIIKNSSYYKHLEAKKFKETERQKAKEMERNERERLVQLEKEATFLRRKLSAKSP